MKGSRKPRRRLLDRSGVTLLELILVMVVLFTLAGVVAPRFSNVFPGLQVRESADTLLAWALKARSDAATTGLRHRLVLSPSQRKFWIELESNPFKEPDAFTVLRGAWGEETLPEDVALELAEGFEKDGTSRSYLEFKADGTAEDAAVVVSNGQGDRRTVRVVGATSRVFIEPPAEATR
jgi:type II secretory pathway pseudopilin PulG